MKMTFEIKANDENGGSWSLQTDGHEWEYALTTAEVLSAINSHVNATMDCLIAEVREA